MLCRLLGQEIFGGNNASIVYGRQREKVMQNGREEVREKEIEREQHIKREIECEGERGRQWEGTHHRVCLVCKVFIGDPCAQQFQIDAKKKSNENR